MIDTIETEAGCVQFDDPKSEIPLDSDQADEALARLGRDIPPDVEIGRPVAVAVFDPAEFAVGFAMSTGAYLWSYPAHAERLVELGEGDAAITEFTSWCGGLETDRRVGRTQDFRRPSAVE